MGVVYETIPLDEVVKVLRTKGYGREGRRQYALALNKPTGKLYETGGEIRVFFGGLTHEQLDSVLKYSNSVQEAAHKVERICMGEQILPAEPDAISKDGPVGISMEVAEKLIVNRCANEIAMHLGPIKRELTELAKNLCTALDEIQKLRDVPRGTTEKKKPGPKPGSKRVPMKDQIAKFIETKGEAPTA